MDLNIDALHSFSVFAETLNFTHAAERLYISQPALHVKIKKLSTQLGVPLYVKRGKHLELTRYGKDVARFGRETQASIDGFVSELQGLDREATQPVSLAAGNGCYLYLLGDAIRRFRKRSKSPLRLITSDSQATIEQVETGEAQIGATVLQSLPKRIQTSLIANVPAKLIVPSDHALAQRQDIGVANLKKTELIVPPQGRPHRIMISKILEMKNVDWGVAMEADGWAMMVQFVAMGMGLAIVNGCCHLPKGVAGVPIRDFPGTRYYLLTRRNLELTSDQKLLCQLIRSDAEKRNGNSKRTR